MAALLGPTDPQRLRHHHGERLLLRDADDQAALDDQLRWWHNRALHHAYGVVEGLSVRAIDGSAPPTVVVDAGLAFDAFGRELILADPREIEMPDSTGSRCLVIVASTSRVGEVDLQWISIEQLDARSGVPLAFDERAARPVPRARPVARPRIGRGATIPGQTPWQLWTEEPAEGERMLLGLEAAVDTSAAGFTDVPCYFVQVTGSMFSEATGLPILPFGHVAAASRDGFVFRLLMPSLVLLLRRQRFSPGTRPDLRKSFRGRSSPVALSLTWTGIQSDRGSKPRPPFHRIEVSP